MTDWGLSALIPWELFLTYKGVMIHSIDCIDVWVELDRRDIIYCRGCKKKTELDLRARY
jgi:hypothetical protein